MQLPISFINSLEGLPGFEKEAFIHCHAELEDRSSLRLNPAKNAELPYSLLPVPWSSLGYYVSPRPSFTFDPFFHAGCYYVQEASSMCLEQAFIQHKPIDKPLLALDLCASPGGKTTHLYSLLAPGSVLVANEVIKSRASLLRDNCIKWGTESVVVTQNDPAHFNELPDFFDWITLDAPCSGSGLFRKDPEAIHAWSPAAVTHCAQRQQRIFAAAWESLKPGGVLFYSTCSYSNEENEWIIEWAQEQLGASVLPISIDPSWGVVAASVGYRCWPHRLRGEGFYFCCVQKSAANLKEPARKKGDKFLPLPAKENERLSTWVQAPHVGLFEVNKQLHGWPLAQWEALSFLKSKLYIQYAGVRMGEWMREKFIPDHALALVAKMATSASVVSLEKEEAIRYLQRKEFSSNTATKGWNKVLYNGFGLGWINVLEGRINNYYPAALRILKDKG